jgi:hypothetical protein
MKLAKLSLAAIMTVGALSTMNAANLEDSIKGVNFSGFARYRLNDVSDGNPQASHKSDNDIDVRLKATSKVTDTVSFTGDVGLRNNNDNGTGATTTGDLELAQAYFTYSEADLMVKAGKQNTATPVTDNGWMGNYGTGVLATYGMGNVSLAGVYYGNTNALGAEDISGVGAMGSFGVVNAQAWAITTEDTIDALYFGQVDGTVAGLSLTGQVISTTVAGGGANDTGLFYGVKAGYSMDSFAFNAGYTKNDADQPTYTLSADGSPIFPGWRLGYVTANAADAEAMYADGSVSFGKIGVKVGYATATYDVPADAVNDTGITEIYTQLSYKVAKNLNTYVKYSDIDEDIDANDQKYFRFEAKYSF